MRGCLSKVIAALFVVVLAATWLGSPTSAFAHDVESDGTDSFNVLVAYPFIGNVSGFSDIGGSFVINLQPHAGAVGRWQCTDGYVGAGQGFYNWSGTAERDISYTVPTIHEADGFGLQDRCWYVINAVASPDNLYAAQGFDISNAQWWGDIAPEGGIEEPDPEPTPSPTPTPTPPDPYTFSCTVPSATGNGSCTDTEPDTSYRYVWTQGQTFRVNYSFQMVNNCPANGQNHYYAAALTVVNVASGTAIGFEPLKSVQLSGTGISAQIAEYNFANTQITYRSTGQIVGAGKTQPNASSIIGLDAATYAITGLTVTPVGSFAGCASPGFYGVTITSVGNTANAPQTNVGDGGVQPTPTPAGSPTPTPRPPATQPPPPSDGGFDVCDSQYSASEKSMCQPLPEEPPVTVEVCGPEEANLAICQPVEPWDGPEGGSGGAGPGYPTGGGTGDSGVTECEPTPVTEKVGYVAPLPAATFDDLAVRVEGKDPLAGLGEALGWIGDMIGSLPAHGVNAVYWLWNQVVDAIVPGACLGPIIEGHWQAMGDTLPLSLFFDAKDAIDGAVAGAGSITIPGIPLPGGGSLAFPLADWEAAVSPYRGVMGAAVYLGGALYVFRTVAGTFGVARGPEQLTLGL